MIRTQYGRRGIQLIAFCLLLLGAFVSILANAYIIYRARRTPLSSQPIISGFTPVNATIVNTTPTLLAPAQTPFRGRKRSAGQLETPPSTSKKLRKTSQPRQPKQPKRPKQKLDVGDQDISRGLPRTKKATKEDRALLYKPASSPPDDGPLLQEQASVVGAELSTAILCKPNALRYRAGKDEDSRKPYQAEPPKSQVDPDLLHPQLRAHEQTQIRSTSYHKNIDDDHDVDNVWTESRMESAMRPAFTRPIFAIDTKLIAENGSIGEATTPTRQAAEELLRAANEFHRGSRELEQAHGQNGNFDGYDQTLLPTICAASSLGDFPQTSSPHVQRIALSSPIVWDGGGDEALLAMFTNHNELGGTPDPEDCTVHQTSCHDVSPATRIRSLPDSNISDAFNVHFVDRQESGATEDEFPVEDEELSDMMQLPAGQEPPVPASSFPYPSEGLSQRNEVHDTTATRFGTGSGKNTQPSLQEDEYIPTSAQIAIEAESSPPEHPQKYPSTDLHPRSYLGNANDTQMNSDQHSCDLGCLNQHGDSYFPDTAEAFSDDEHEPVSSLGWPPCPKFPSNTTPVHVPVPILSHVPSVRSCTPEVQPCSVTNSIVAQPRSARENLPMPSHLIDFTADGSPKPFVRPKFPPAIRDRSRILGLSPRNPHRTCFRIGEALNAASAASRTSNDVLIELYALVISSTREEGRSKQHFEFADLFSSHKPPFLSGTYDLWKGVPLWDSDSGSFLGGDGEGRLARVIGRITRDEESKAWRMRILNVWAAGLEDVAWVKGIVCA